MTRYLVDTHAFLWLATGDPQLTTTVIEIFSDPAHEIFLSAASIWEMAIQSSIGKLVLQTTLDQLVRGGVERGIRILDVTARHAYGATHLPFHHRDPFDRMLVAQALHEGLQIISPDDWLDPYAVARVW